MDDDEPDNLGSTHRPRVRPGRPAKREPYPVKSTQQYTGNRTLDMLLTAAIADPGDDHTLSALLDFLSTGCHPDHATAALRILLQDAADAAAARRRLQRADKVLGLIRRGEDLIEDGLSRVIRLAKESERRRDALLNMAFSERVDT